MQSNRWITSLPQLARLLTAATGLALTACQEPADAAFALDELDEPADAPEDEVLDERQRMARSGRFLLDPSAGGNAVPATAEDLVGALDADWFVVDSTLTGADVSSAVYEQWGVISPRRGDSFAVLSTGVVNTTPEPGTDMGGPGEADDVVTLSLDLEIPEGFSRLSFDYNFLSAESPDYVGSIYNDTFQATLIDPDGVAHPIAMASVNSSTFFDASSERAGGTSFDIFTLDPAGVDSDFTGGLPDAGITDFQAVSFAVPSAGSWTLVFEIRDLGDGLLDSAVIIDNLRIHAIEPLALNPPTTTGTPALIEGNGAIVTDAAALTQASQVVRGIAADGNTQVLLRTRVPGPGTVEYALDGGAHPADGGVGALNGPAGASVAVQAVESSPGVYHAFATYTAPVDFDRGTDGELETRSVDIRATFTPDSASLSGFVDVQPLVLQRPPVVLVHGLWDVPAGWTLPLLDDPRISVHRASYTSTDRLSTQAHAIPAAILSARLLQQQQGIAGSQVDLVAHGTGGLLARQYLDSAGYASAASFGDGDVHKLITLNTPHLGSSFATAFMETWNDGLNTTQRSSIGSMLATAGLVVDGGAVEDAQVGSPFVQLLDATTVPSHAIAGSGGRSIPRTSATAHALDNSKNLYLIVEQNHPSMPKPATTQPTRLAFVFGESSQVFAEDHDMFVELDSQHGGIAASATTTIASHESGATSSYDSCHQIVPRAPAYSTRILELLDTPASGTLFGSFPAPADLLATAPMLPSSDPASTAPVMLNVVPYGLSILSPVDGAAVVPGGSVHVSLELDPGLGDVVVLGLVTRFASVVVDEPTFPFELDMAVPEDASGSMGFIAFGFTDTGELLISSVVELGATPEAELVFVRMLDRNPFLIGAGATASTEVQGVYDDGIERDITSSTTGTEYLTSDPTVFTVSPEGELLATGVGKATLVARNDGLQDSVTVEVVDGLTGSFDITAAWSTGYCATLDVTNHTSRATSDWSFTIDIGDTTITESWNGLFSGATGTITIEPEFSWQLGIPGGQTMSHTGFCASKAYGSTPAPAFVAIYATF
jgi:hypothetical protein